MKQMSKIYINNKKTKQTILGFCRTICCRILALITRLACWYSLQENQSGQKRKEGDGVYKEKRKAVKVVYTKCKS